MNLNTFERHGVFDDAAMVALVADRLQEPGADRARRGRFRTSCWRPTRRRRDVPALIADALQDAMEIATENVPAFAGKVLVFPDVSGSMQFAGHRACARARPRRCAASTSRRWSPRRSCGAIRRRK